MSTYAQRLRTPWITRAPYESALRQYIGAPQGGVTTAFSTFFFGAQNTLSLATVTFASSIESVTFTDVPAAVTKPNQDAGGRRHTRYILRVDGEEFAVRSLAEALSLLDKAKALAKKHAREAARVASVAQTRLTRPPIPEISGNSEIRAACLEVQHEIAQIYESAYRDAEIAMWMAVIKRNEQNEDAVLLLM